MGKHITGCQRQHSRPGFDCFFYDLHFKNMGKRECGVLLWALYVNICKDILLCLQSICLYQALVGTHPNHVFFKMLELGPAFLLLSKQITKKRRNSTNRESWSLMRFITNNLYRISMLLLRILGR